MNALRAVYLFIFISFSALCYGQTSLKFCVEVKNGGSCQSPSNEFNVSADGGTISFLVETTDSLNTANIIYKLYSIQPDGTEIYLKDINQPINRGWNYAWVDVIFYDPGSYKVRAYDADHENAFMSSGILKIFR
ncbi:MAG: hypothetical protein U0V74_05670 [Chitinophagales bacterium]